jgi:hypothetical protein
MDIKIGTIVKYRSILSRENMSRENRRCYKNWQKKGIAERTGFLVGFRTFSNGFIQFHHFPEDESPIEYTPMNFLRVAIVAWHLRRKLDFVLIEDLEF